MKQSVSDKQYSQLKESQKSILVQWCADNGYEMKLSIGQMIQLISERKPLKSVAKTRFDKWIVNIDTATLGYKDELCDSLWETVTRIL